MLGFVTTNNSATDATVGRLELVPEDALRLYFMQAGFLDRPIQPFEQTHPFTILSQTLVGSQVVHFADVEVSAYRYCSIRSSCKSKPFPTVLPGVRNWVLSYCGFFAKSPRCARTRWISCTIPSACCPFLPLLTSICTSRSAWRIWPI